MNGIFETIILMLLSIITIRSLIAQNFDIPLAPRFKWIIYNKKDQNPVLCSRVYERNQGFNNGSSVKSIIERLLIMDGKHTKKFNDGYFHRHKFSTEMRSEYFINSLEASYVDYDLNIMTIAIQRLIEESGLANIDFVLFLKNGNYKLAQSVFNKDRTIIYICKIDETSSYIPKGTTIPIDKYSIQYENLDCLLNAANSIGNRPNLTGIAIDCSISTGVGLKDSITHFNELLDSNPKIKINKIQHAFILYSHQVFDDADINFKLHRYFDMNEEIRTLIYNEITLADNKGAGARKVYDTIKEKKLLHNDL